MVYLWIILSLLVGALGHNRRMGFWQSFLISLILSPLVGLISVLLSRSRSSIEREKLTKQLEELAKNQEKNATPPATPSE